MHEMLEGVDDICRRLLKWQPCELRATNRPEHRTGILVRVCQMKCVSSKDTIEFNSLFVVCLRTQGFSMFANKGWLTKEDGGGLDKPVLGVR